MVNSLVIFTHSRAELLNKCIRSVLNAKNSDSWRKVLIHQQEFDSVKTVVDKYLKKFDLVITLKPISDVPLENINFNRVLGTQICFDKFNSNLVLGIEEDTIIGYDSLIFIDRMYNKYKNNRSFRGINLGSRETLSASNKFTYSLIRFGLQAQAGVLTRKTWTKVYPNKILDKKTLEGWDSKIEFILKNGFMVTPNASRMLDQGWGGTHVPKNPLDPYFIGMKNSWVGQNSFKIKRYHVQPPAITWRHDSVPYKKRDSIFYIIRSTFIGYKISTLRSNLNVQFVLSKLKKFKLKI